MPEMTTYLTRITLLIGIITTSFPALSHNGEQQFVHVSAMLRAGAELCNAYSASELNDLQDHQRSTSSTMGISPAEFDEMFGVSYANARHILAELSPAEKAEICQELDETPITEWYPLENAITQ